MRNLVSIVALLTLLLFTSIVPAGIASAAGSRTGPRAPTPASTLCSVTDEVEVPNTWDYEPAQKLKLRVEVVIVAEADASTGQYCGPAYARTRFYADATYSCVDFWVRAQPYYGDYLAQKTYHCVNFTAGQTTGWYYSYAFSMQLCPTNYQAQWATTGLSNYIVGNFGCIPN